MRGARPNRLLLVEDDAELTELVTEALVDEGYVVDQARDGQRGLHLGLTRPYDVLVIDRRLPGLDGLDLVVRLRSRAVPARALMLTALGTVGDRIAGLDAGADDYLVKPFALEELIARLEAQLRRPGHLLESNLRIANLEFDTRNRQASIDDQPQLFSARETAVLELLMRSKGRVVSKKQVEDHIFGHSGEVASNAIEVYVHRLRRQLSDRGARVQVHTIRGVGYLIAEEK
jgi:DNA-binding response OmpR family regulator